MWWLTPVVPKLVMLRQGNQEFKAKLAISQSWTTQAQILRVCLKILSNKMTTIVYISALEFPFHHICASPLFMLEFWLA